MSETYVFILAGGAGTRLSILTEHRAKPGVPFAGKFRIIDFALSNCANSGLFDVGLLTQYRPTSLIDHVGTGRTWDMDRILGGLQVLQPYQVEESRAWYTGTADAVYRNLLQVTERDVEDVLVLSGDHVYAMDYRLLLRYHRDRRFPATVAVTPVPETLTDQFGIVQVNDGGVITGFQEKPRKAIGNLASMGIYAFRRETLIRLLTEDAGDPDSSHDFGKNVLPRLTRSAKVGAYTFRGYWQDIGTLEAFFEANMKLLDPDHQLKLAHPSWPVRTPSVDAPPAALFGEGSVHASLVANGAVIRGRVERSVLSPGVVVEEGAEVADAILLNDVRVERGATVRHAILDKRTRVGPGAAFGGEGSAPPNRDTPRLLQSGLSVAGKEVRMEPGSRVGRNCCLGQGVRLDPDQVVPDGETRHRAAGTPAGA